MISTGITGTARHGTSPNSASWMRVNTLHALRAAGGQDRRAGARHVRRVGIVADRLQGEIGLHAGGEIERAAMEQRPAAMRALDRAQIDGDLAPAARRRCGRDNAPAGCIRPGWSRPPPARTPSGRPAFCRRVSACAARVDRVVPGRASAMRACQVCHRHAPISLTFRRAEQSRRAARRPDLIAPSMVAGNPVAVQSPASTQFCQVASWRAAADALLRRRSRRRWRASPSPRARAASAPAGCSAARTSGQTAPARSSARRVHQPVGGADGDRDDARLDEYPLRGAADQAPRSPASPGSASTRKCRLTIASKHPARSGPAAERPRPGPATASTTLSPAPSGTAPSGGRSAVTRSASMRQRGDPAAESRLPPRAAAARRPPGR